MDNETPNHDHHGPTTPIDHLICPALEQLHALDDPLSQLHEDVLQDLKESTGQILEDLSSYRRSRHELVLMFHDIPPDKAVHLMNAMEDERMEDERNVALQESIWQEQDGQRKQEQEGQRVYDDGIGQMRDDVLFHANMMTEQIIANFEDLTHSSEEESTHSPESNSDRRDEPPESSEDASDHLNDNSDSDDLNENTDTEDGKDELCDLEESLQQSSRNLLKANTQLLNFLTKQSATIARLRRRIVRLSTMVMDLQAPLNANSTTLYDARVTTPHKASHSKIAIATWNATQKRNEEGISNHGFENIGIYTGTNTECYHLHDEASSMASNTNAMAPSRLPLRSPLRDMPHEPLPYPNPTVMGGGDLASVLVDQQSDTSFLLKPNCESKFGTTVTMQTLDHKKIQAQLSTQLAKIKTIHQKDELWMYFDSGASRSVISTTSPIRTHLQAVRPTYGSCSIGDGTPLQYIEKGNVMNNLEVTVVQDLKYDLFSSVSAAKQGLTSVIDFDLDTGENNSYTIDKFTGNVTPLVERGKGILELPLHTMLTSGACFSLIPARSPTQDALPPHIVSMFWHYYDDDSFDPYTRNNNQTEYSLFTFDIIKSLNERERDFLIHARMGHLPRKTIFQMIKNGTTGIKDYSGKFKELCKPCMQAKQRAENHGHVHKRHPNGRPGEHLHSDLAVLSTLDIKGNKYVLTVVDEISHEVIIALLKRKTAEDVCRVSQQIQKTIAARTGNKLLTWQFDRGTEFLNSTFEQWLKLELGVTQRFSTIEHPWENGMAERSFQTLFSLCCDV